MNTPTLFTTTSSPSASTAASLIASTKACSLTAASVTNGAASARFVLIFDATTLPGDGTVPTYCFPIAASATWVLPKPLTFANGCVMCLSSTAPTKTITAADSTFSGTVATDPSAALFASAVISNTKCVLDYALVTNTSGADRWYVLCDAASVPALTAAATMPPTGGIASPRIGAGQPWRPLPLDLSKGAAFNAGVVLMSFPSRADGQPDYTQLSSADARVVAYTAALA